MARYTPEEYRAQHRAETRPRRYIRAGQHRFRLTFPHPDKKVFADAFLDVYVPSEPRPWTYIGIVKGGLLQATKQSLSPADSEMFQLAGNMLDALWQQIAQEG